MSAFHKEQKKYIFFLQQFQYSINSLQFFQRLLGVLSGGVKGVGVCYLPYLVEKTF